MRHFALAALVMAVAVVFAAGSAAPMTAPTAAAPPEARRLRYEVWWGGLYAAEFTLSLTETNGESVSETPVTFDNDFALRTRGILDWLMGFGLSAESRGAAETRLVPAIYAVEFSDDWGRGRTAIRYRDDDGPEVARFSAKGDGPLQPETDPPDEAVPPDATAGTVDPLTAFADSLRPARRLVAAAAEPGATFTIPVFDGKRRFDVAGTLHGREQRHIDDSENDVWRLHLATRRVGGPKQDRRVVWDETAFDVFLSADSRLVPLQIAAVGPGPVMTLVERCPQKCVMAE